MDRPPDLGELPADLKAALEGSPCRFARAAAVYYVPRGALAAPAREACKRAGLIYDAKELYLHLPGARG